MNRSVRSLWVLLGLSAVSTAAAQDFYPDFALVVQLPSYESFLTNLGGSPVRVDGYQISSKSGSLKSDGLGAFGLLWPGNCGGSRPRGESVLCGQSKFKLVGRAESI